MTQDPEDIAAKAERVQAEAAGLPSLERVTELAVQAIAHGGTPHMSIDEVRDLASQAVTQAKQVTALLERLSELLAPPPPGGERQ